MTRLLDADGFVTDYQCWSKTGQCSLLGCEEVVPPQPLEPGQNGPAVYACDCNGL